MDNDLKKVYQYLHNAEKHYRRRLTDHFVNEKKYTKKYGRIAFATQTEKLGEALTTSRTILEDVRRIVLGVDDL